MNNFKAIFGLGAVAAAMWGAQSVFSAPTQRVQIDASTTRIEVVLSGGHETDPRDMGRPVVLIASALGVPPEVFREAFSHVQPAPAGTAPDQEQVRRNKDALLDALARYGVTNERLDEVSNYYRYNRRRGEMWPTTPAKAYALLKNGKITGFEVTEAGAGYISPPTVTIPGAKPDNSNTIARAQLAFGPTLETNGSLARISLAPAKTP